jgi:excisionase family DNA binding protein
MQAVKSNLSTFAIAKMLHVDPGSVANWVDRGMLKAYRTPGGHRRISREDLAEFCRAHGMPIPKELTPEPVRILVVDDNPTITKLISQAIKARHPDYDVVEAHDGFSSGTIIATLRPDVVILDLRMPGMDGVEVCRLIKSQEQSKSAEVLAMTAYPSDDNVEKVLDMGARICLSKPLDMDLMLKEIESAL